MACSTASRDFLVSEYVKSLDQVASSRYYSKLTYDKGSASLPDPYALKGWQNNPTIWPDLSFGDMYTYLIDTPGIYTKESLKAFKSLEAYQFFLSGHVKPLWYHSVEDGVPFCFIKGRVIPSQRPNDKPHDTWVCLYMKEASVYCAHCTCMAGLGEVCSHVAALLFKVETGVRLGLTQSSCTSEACQWNSAFREKINARSVAEFKDLVKRNRKREVRTVDFMAAPPLPDTTVLQSLKEVCPNAAFFSMIPKLDPEATDSASEDEDETDLPQPLTSLYSEEYASLTADELKEKSGEIISNFQLYTPKQRESLELITRNQTVSPLWYEHRKGRITASKAHRIVQLKSTTPRENLVKTLMGYNTYDLSRMKQVKWGIDNEEEARQQYVSVKQISHEDFNCRLSGFMIDPVRPYLGASADGIATCKCCPPRVVEIKCPFKHKDSRPIDAAKSDPEFCLDPKGNLKINHPYYTQVQVQAHVNQMKYADLCVYTNEMVHIVEDIEYSDDLMELLLEKGDAFFADYLLPEILARKLDINNENNEQEEASEDDQDLFCVCNQPEHGKMIQCDNDTCDIVWFHYSCVNIRRKPRGNWYCMECKEED